MGRLAWIIQSLTIVPGAVVVLSLIKDTRPAAVVGFVVFAVVAWIAALVFQLRIRTVEDAKPCIRLVVQTNPVELLHGLLVEVYNEGATAEFGGQIEILESATGEMCTPQEMRFDTCWEGEESPRVIIMGDHSRSMKLATFESNQQFGWLHIYMATKDGIRYHSTSAHPIFKQEAPVIVSEFLVRLTVSSTPQSRNGAQVRLIRFDARMNVNMLDKDEYEKAIKQHSG